ncbi:MAG: hypothetical protein LBH32_06460 [Dysgonamonadaceae bacterium]|nr:hypothetical protein [Dysgonamonadaceae bacterium]
MIEQLVIDFEYNEDKAADIFFSSAVFAQLSYKTTNFYQKSWLGIYEMLKTELKK